MPDGVLKPIREVIRKLDEDAFPLQQITDRFKGTNRSLIFTEDDISNLLYTKYGQGNTTVVMAVLYPWADMRNRFHIDHMYPKSAFTYKKLEKRGLTSKEIEFAMNNVNYLANLQLLEAIPNIEKKDRNFDQWLTDTVPPDAIADYKERHLIPKDIELTFPNFEGFFTKREWLIMERLKRELL
jgi:hypothetical protein